MPERSARLGLVTVMALSWLGGCVGPAKQAGISSAPDAPAAIVTWQVPALRTDLVARLDRYQESREAALMGWLGDGVLVSTRFGDTRQLHRVHQALGRREQLTFFRDPVSEVAVPPVAVPEGFVYSRDQGGSENYQLYWFDLGRRTSTLLTDGHSRYGQVVWSREGDRFAYSATERNGRDWDLYVRAPGGSSHLVVRGESGFWGAEDFAPGGEALLVSRYVSANVSELYELHLASGRLRPVLAPDLVVSVGDARYSADGSSIYFTSDLGAEFMRLHRLDRSSGDIDVLTAEVPWNVEHFELDAGGRWLAYVINEHGTSRVEVLSLPGHTFTALPEMPAGIVRGLGFDPSGYRLGIARSSATSPEDVWVLNLADRTFQRWTDSEVGGLDTDRFVEPRLVEFESFDGLSIPAFVFEPAGVPGPHPVLITVHGGPEAQYRPYFSPVIQFLVQELGVCVIAPNVRGSSGYGKTYLKLDNGQRREDAVRDIGALLDWIALQGDLDVSRVAVVGGSYGGYMVLASLVHFSERLTAGVERVGISNFVTFLENTADFRRDLRRAEYGDERDPDMRRFLHRISPLNRVDAITRPLLISQGANDPRVPRSESEQMVQALDAAGVPVWYVLALDEGHGMRRKPNRDYNTAVTMMFLERYLLGGERGGDG